MIVELETLLDSPASECIAAVMTPALLQHVASPWLSFEPVAASEWPARWEPGPFPVRMKLFGWLPLGVQTVDISVPVVGPGTFRVRDNGHSALIERWDHLISIEAVGSGTRYTDRVDIRAGWRTPFVWLFARGFYAHRQRRWRRLAASGDLAGFSLDAKLLTMLRLPSIWLLCFGLVLTRLLGLHVHACSGIEGTPHQHEPTHYADSGFLFGESHAQDHGDNLELELAAAVPSTQIPFPDVSDDLALPASDRLQAPAASGWMTVRTPRGPPAAHATRPANFAPPLRGPPSYSLA